MHLHWSLDVKEVVVLGVNKSINFRASYLEVNSTINTYTATKYCHIVKVVKVGAE